MRSGSRSLVALRFGFLRAADIPTSMYLRITRFKLGRNLRKSGLLEIPFLFDVVRQDGVTVFTETQLQAHDIRCEDCPVGILHFITADLIIDVTN